MELIYFEIGDIWGRITLIVDMIYMNKLVISTGHLPTRIVKPLKIITKGFNKIQQAALPQLVLQPNIPDTAQGLGGWRYHIQNQNDAGETKTTNTESNVIRSKI